MIKKMLLVVLLLAGASAGLLAQSKTSLLWKVEGPDLEKPSYLFGTIHLISQSDFFMPEMVKTAIDESDEIYLELDMDDPSMPMQMMQFAEMDGDTTLQMLFSEAEITEIDKAVKAQANMGIDFIKSWQPMLVSSFMYPALIEGKPASYEMTIMQIANEQEKEIKGLETVEEQMSAIGRISYTKQAEQLRELLNDQEGQKELFQKMVNLYKEQDIQRLYDYILQQTGGEEMGTYLLDPRNVTMADRFDALPDDKSYFVAVGAGHLAGGELVRRRSALCRVPYPPDGGTA